MADTKISALANGAPALAADAFPIARAGANYQLTLTNVLNASLAAAFSTITASGLITANAGINVGSYAGGVTTAGQIGFASGTLNYGDGSANQVVMSLGQTQTVTGAKTFSALVTANLGLTVAGAAFTSRGITDNAALKALQLNNVASAVNYFSLSHSATTNAPQLAVDGTDTNIDLRIVGKGTGGVDIMANNQASYLARFIGPASTSNYFTFTASNGGSPTIGVSGGELAISNSVTIASGKFLYVGDGGAAGLANALNVRRATANDVGFISLVRDGVVTHLFKTGGTVGNPADLVYSQDGGGLFYVNSALSVNGAGNIATLYPGSDAAAFQTNAAIRAGSGAPNNANGNNGDYYFRSDGGAGTYIYKKAAGAWAGIV